MRAEVECYAGFKADQRPLQFTVARRGNVYRVAEVLDQWYSPSETWFKVLTEDGGVYILKLREPSGQWTMESYRAASPEERSALEPRREV